MNNGTPITASEAGIAGFWRRVLAFWLDGLILALPVLVAGIFLFDQFAALGGWGRVVGFVIALAYFGLLNSALTNGQTPGKKCVRIRTVDESNQPIGLGRSCARYSVLGLPFFLNGAPLLHSAPGWVIGAAAVIVFGVGGAILYLFIFNRKNRRSLHDLVAGTYVIRSDRDVSATKPRTWKGHFFIMTVLLLLMIGGWIGAFSLIKPATFARLLDLQQTLLRQPDISAASVVDGTSVMKPFGGEQTSSTYLKVDLRLRRRPQDYDRRGNELAALVFEKYPEAQTRARTVISLDYGYDLGIARWSITRGFNFTTAEWQERLGAAAPLQE